MSEKSFAAGTVAVAVIWGTFFYPPPPPTRALHSAKAASAPAVAAARSPRRDARLADAAPQPAGAPERRWWRRNLLEWTSSRTQP